MFCYFDDNGGKFWSCSQILDNFGTNTLAYFVLPSLTNAMFYNIKPLFARS